MEKLHLHQCVRCDYKIDTTIHKFSTKKFGYCLCFKCQDWFKTPDQIVTQEAKLFALELQSRNVNLKIEQFDGFKHIDIAIPSYYLNIEIDGSHHYTKVEQSLADIKRTCNSLKKEYTTIRIPNILIEKKEDREEVADVILDYLKIKKKQIEQKNKQVKITALLKEFYKMNF